MDGTTFVTYRENNRDRVSLDEAHDGMCMSKKNEISLKLATRADIHYHAPKRRTQKRGITVAGTCTAPSSKHKSMYMAHRYYSLTRCARLENI